MKKVWITARCAALILLCWSLTVSASEQQPPSAGTEPNKKEAAALFEEPEILLQIPLMSPLFEDVTIAVVNEDTIALKNLIAALASSHEGRKPGEEKQAAHMDYSEILKRLINVRLIVQEAKQMGMDELPEVKEEISTNRRLTAKEVLIEDITKDAKVDEALVEKYRKEMSREWKIKSVFFEKEEDAKKMEEAIKAGKSFEELVAKAVEDKTAKAQGEGGYVKSRDLLPGIAAVVSKMEIGSVSPVVQVGSGKEAGFSIMKLDEIRYPEDPETTAKAREAAHKIARKTALTNFEMDSYKKNVKVNEKLLKGLDFEAKKPGFKKLLQDKRNVATVKGEPPITVAELAKALEIKFFHGIDRAIAEKKVNDRKQDVFEELYVKRLFEKEIADRGIEKTEKFNNRMKEYEDSLLFGYFIQKVMFPDVKLDEEELKAYYDEHVADYTTPEMMKLSGLVFDKREQAESALERLKKGADFNWMKSNAEGQVDSTKRQDALSFEGTTMVVNNLPETAQKALSGAKAEEFRMFESPDEGLFYVLYVQVVAPPSPQPFKEVRGEISKKVFDKKLNVLLDDWTRKLRESGKVKIYLASPSPAGDKTQKH